MDSASISTTRQLGRNTGSCYYCRLHKLGRRGVLSTSASFGADVPACSVHIAGSTDVACLAFFTWTLDTSEHLRMHSPSYIREVRGIKAFHRGFACSASLLQNTFHRAQNLHLVLNCKHVAATFQRVLSTTLFADTCTRRMLYTQRQYSKRERRIRSLQQQSRSLNVLRTQ